MSASRAWTDRFTEASRLAVDAVVTHRARSALAIAGIVIGLVTVVLVASVLANVRSQIALLFRDLGTENVFAFHLSGDPYSAPNEQESRREPLDLAFVPEVKRLSTSAADVGAQIIVPTTGTRPLVVRAGSNDSDTALVEGFTPTLFDIIGAEFVRGRPFTELESRQRARVAVLGASLARALFGSVSPVGRTVSLAGQTYTVVGELAERRGGFLGENRQDNVLTLPAGTVRAQFGAPARVVLYVRAKPGERAACYAELEAILRRLRKLPAEAPNDFNLSTADQIISTFDDISARVALATVGLASISLFIGAIGIANVMFISVTERTREIGLRMAVGAVRREVLLQFLLESVFLAGIGGATGVAVALLIGLLVSMIVTGFSAVPPLWAVMLGAASSIGVGVIAGFIPARRAARLDPVEALRRE
jgi:putative ABC transport system permease protein